ncbi:hypothetical protein DSCO28_08810 [Desulfosarcina ovata subsp. sediminis]|uniref:OmpA-like domain-containing protein n=1 Tax=Desulfosarcina ovata subsp. sediminis TaxID=885957 RepID=A0A5K7ZJC6_9BACT|nr:hypothetical protein DSCO28_08810 [Desulfosarcina ovata subsp. sediminis]
MKKITLILFFFSALTACAHNGGNSFSEQGIYVESPYFPTEISVDGKVVGTTPLVIDYSTIHQRELKITAVALEDETFRQELVFSIPPLPRKIVVLALHTSAPVVSAESSQATVSAQGTHDSSKGGASECLPEPIFTPVIFFNTDKSDISPPAQETLRAFCDIMKNNAYHMEIVGFADERHWAPYNLKLSLERARAVFETLHSLGLSANRMHVEGRGEIQTLNGQGHQMSWDHNRRVEIRIHE